MDLQSSRKNYPVNNVDVADRELDFAKGTATGSRRGLSSDVQRGWTDSISQPAEHANGRTVIASAAEPARKKRQQEELNGLGLP